MSAILDVASGAAEAEDQEVAKAFFGAFEIVLRIHGSEDVVAGNLPIESSDEAAETVLANQGIYFVVSHELGEGKGRIRVVCGSALSMIDRFNSNDYSDAKQDRVSLHS